MWPISPDITWLRLASTASPQTPTSTGFIWVSEQSTLFHPGGLCLAWSLCLESSNPCFLLYPFLMLQELPWPSAPGQGSMSYAPRHTTLYLMVFFTVGVAPHELSDWVFCQPLYPQFLAQSWHQTEHGVHLQSHLAAYHGRRSQGCHGYTCQWNCWGVAQPRELKQKQSPRERTHPL